MTELEFEYLPNPEYVTVEERWAAVPGDAQVWWSTEYLPEVGELLLLHLQNEDGLDPHRSGANGWSLAWYDDHNAYYWKLVVGPEPGVFIYVATATHTTTLAHLKRVRARPGGSGRSSSR